MRIIDFPAAVLPVNTSRLTRGSRISGATASLVPLTTLSTPGGSPSARSSNVRVMQSGAVGGGFTMTVQPATSA
jgi:hypothetical protein